MLALAGPVGASATPATAIVGGGPARSAYADVGSLQIEHNGYPDWHFCGGHLVGDNGHGESDLVVTNAHCVSTPPSDVPAPQLASGPQLQTATKAGYFRSSFPPGTAQSKATSATGLTFVAGSTDRFAGEHVGVARIVAPDRWAWGTPDPGVVDRNTQGWIWDIVVLKLEHPVRYRGAMIAPLVAWKPVTALGWGMTDPDPATWTDPAGAQLKATEVPVVPSSECAGAGIGKAEVCLGIARDGGGACAGDSGTGGEQRWGTHRVLTATTSRGPEARCGTVTVYTLLWPYSRWLVQTANQLNTASRVELAQSQFDLAG